MVVLFLTSNEAPDFITLHIIHGNIAALAFKESLTTITRKSENLHDCVLVNASEPLNRTDRATFYQEIDNSFHFLRGSVHAAQVLIARVRVRLVALAAAISLLALASFPKLLALGPAIVARHFLPCLLQVRERK
jgi:hypothetical protein